MQTPGSLFLHEQIHHPRFSKEVALVAGYLALNGEPILNQPSPKISGYLELLADPEYGNDGILTGDADSIKRQVGYHVIVAADIPHSSKLQQRINREKGCRDVGTSPSERAQNVEVIQANQRDRLAQWAEHLSSEDCTYPDWFKYYTFNSVTKLVKDPSKEGEFMKPSHGTTAPCPRLNSTALSYAYDVLNTSQVLHEVVNGGSQDEQLQELLLRGVNFGKLYALAIREVAPLPTGVKGSWTTFTQSPEPEAGQRMAKALQGHVVDWCNTDEATASMQLLKGDFHAFFSKDEKGEDTIVRAGILMADGIVTEVHGISPYQEIELEMADIVAERLRPLPGSEEYIRRSQDMKRLTAIDKKLIADPSGQLTDNELRFLYEMDHDIQGFGNDQFLYYTRDPRIDELRTKRQGRDKPEVARLMSETIRDQTEGAFAAYLAVADQLQAGPCGSESRLSPAEFERLFARTDKEWRQNGVYDHLSEALIANGSHYNLVATPDIAVDEEQLIDLAEAFGKRSSRAAYVNSRLYRTGRYSGQELSGGATGEGVRLSLIPSRSDKTLNCETAAVQARILREQQLAKPHLNLRVPTLLEAITYWYVLEERGYSLRDDDAYEKTYVRHFDLATAVGEDSVPSSHVGDSGQPHLGISYIGSEDLARLALG